VLQLSAGKSVGHIDFSPGLPGGGEEEGGKLRNTTVARGERVRREGAASQLRAEKRTTEETSARG
jgi:hypothetical protein